MKSLAVKNYALIFLFFAFFNVASYLFAGYHNVFVGRNLFYTLCFSLPFFIPTLFMGKHVKKYLLFCFPFFALTGVVDFLHVSVFHTGVTQTVFRIIFESSIDESSDFFEMYFNATLLIMILIYLIVPAIIIYFVRGTVLQKKRKLTLTLLFVVLVASPSTYKGIRKKESPLNSVASYLRFNTFLNPIISFTRYLDEVKALEVAVAKRKNGMGSFTAISRKDIKGKETYVFVLGESGSRNHMSLYGYYRDTNPRLKKMKDELFVFKDVVSPQVGTLGSMKRVMSFADNKDIEPFYKKGSIVDYMKAAGFKVFWLSNQRVYGGNRQFLPIIDSADKSAHLNRRSKNATELIIDEVIFPEFGRMLEDPAEKKFIIIHLYGSHMSYKRRYTRSFSQFEGNEDIRSIHANSKKRIKILNQYDNSRLYNDYILSELIKILKKDGGNSAFLYTSDHGEEVYDRIGFSGHSPASISSLEVPFILWLSDEMKQSRTDLVKRLPQYLNRKFVTEDIIHSLSDLMRISSPEFVSKRSILSADFVAKKRMVGREERNLQIDYDKDFIPIRYK